MPGDPVLAPKDIIAKLPPGFDYSSIGAALNTNEGQGLPDSVKQTLQGVMDEHQKSTILASPPKPAASDVTAVTMPGEYAAQDAAIQTELARRTQEQKQNLISAAQLVPATLAEGIHDLTAGISPSADKLQGLNLRPADAALFNNVIKPILSVDAMLAEGKWIQTGLGWLSKAPMMTRIIESLPQRLADVMGSSTFSRVISGAAIGGGIDVARPNVPGQPSDESPTATAVSPVDVTGWLGDKLAKATDMNPRVALGLAGAGVGGTIGEVLGGFLAGIQKSRVIRAAMTWSPELLTSVRNALASSGIAVDANAGRAGAADQLFKNIRKVVLNEDAAGFVSERLAREDHIMTEVFGGAKIAQPEPPSMPALAPDMATEASTQDLSRLVPVGTPGVQLEPAAPNSQILKYAARDANGKPIGLLTLSKTGPTSADVFTVFVDPSVRRQGIATSLYDAAEASGLQLRSGQSGLSTEGRALVEARAGGPVITPQQSMANELLGTSTPMVTAKNQPTEEDARLIAGIFRTNPGGITIVKGITSTDAIEAAKIKLGMNLDHAVVIRPTLTGDGNVATTQFDAIIARPNYQYPAAADLGSLNSKITTRLKSMSAEAVRDPTTPKTVEGFILSDGTPIKGGLRMTDLTKQLKLQQPIVEGVARPDLALKQASNYVRMEMTGDKEFSIDIPTRLTQEQFNSLGRSFDAVQMNKVTINAPDGTSAVLNQPLGAQVQDQIAKMVKPQSVSSSLTPQMVSQYGRTGVFSGQAAVLPDGTAAEVISKQGSLKGAGAFYKVKDSLTGQVLRVSEKNLTLLPTTLTSEFQPSQMFTQYLNSDERVALAKIRYGIHQGWAEPIQTNGDFKQFANSRGYNVESLRGGKVMLAKVNDGTAEPVAFQNIKAAIEYVRNDYSNLPDITPESVKNILGENVNLGYIGGSGHPPLNGETIPISWDHLQTALDKGDVATARGTSVFEQGFLPSRGLFESVDRIHPDFQTRKMYENMQSATVGQQNFVSKWRSGLGAELPEGVKPLSDIIDMAGPKGNPELIYSWNETPKSTPEAAALWEQMTPGEQKSAVALKDWYRSAYSQFGVDASFVEDYMPKYKEFKNQGNAGTLQQWWQMQGGDPLNPPKGMDWISDMERQGNMDMYERDAFKVATAYLRGAAHTIYMKPALDDANAMTKMIAEKNPGIAAHIGHFVQAVKGTEFPEQQAAMTETFHRLIESLPGEPKGPGAKNLASGMVDLISGMVYSSIFGFNPSIAMRNGADVFMMVWPVLGGEGGFSSAIGQALTTAGRDEAIAARAISMTQGRRFDQPAVEESIRNNVPEFMAKLNEQGMRMYDKTDEFTRSAAYFAAKNRAVVGLERFAQNIQGASPAAIDVAKRKLMVTSRMFLQDPQIGEEFLRRAASDPELAARFAGKQGADMTNFNYGRGMQPQWMRTVAGRLFGQFATWPIWYVDYLRRMTYVAARNGFADEGMKILARHALVNAAIIGAGKSVLNIDMSKWATYNSVFYGGGPGFSIAQGLSTLTNGLSQTTTESDNPQAASQVANGVNAIWRTLPTYVPLFFAGRNIVNMAQAQNGTELLAAALGTRPTHAFTLQDRIDRLSGVYNPPFQSSSPALEDISNAAALGKPTVDLRGVGTTLGLSPSTGLQPGSATNPGKQSSSSKRSVTRPAIGLPTGTPPNAASHIPESTPSKGF